MQMRLTYEYPVGAWKKFADVSTEGIHKAGKTAVAKTAETARDNSRRNIAAAGFSKRWQNAMRFSIDNPPAKNAIASALIFHSIPFAVVFEEGATIRGKPKLWIPIEANLPPDRHWKARDYVARIGPLVSVNRPGKPPLLFAKRFTPKKSPLSQERRERLAQVKAQRRMNKPAVTAEESKPLFVGVDAVTIRKRFNIRDQIRAAVGHMADEYYIEVAKELPNG